MFLQDTGGTYGVGMSDKHVEECVRDHAPPPPTRDSGAGASLVRLALSCAVHSIYAWSPDLRHGHSNRDCLAKDNDVA